jgi:branched-chain amino acid transport system ATP-binding protein
LAESAMLEVADLHVQYGQLKVLHGVSLSVARGQIVSVVGANAAGKSTLVNAISGLVAPTEGRVILRGADITRLPAYTRVGMGLVQVPEGRKLFPLMTVEENLLVAAVCRRAKPERPDTIRRVFRMFPRLEERRQQMAGTLSGGEQQMLAIGRGLMSKPEVLILDEPSIGLAPILVAEILKTVRALNQSAGLTILLIEQNVRHSLAISDFGYVIENGRIVLADTGERLLTNEHTKRAYLGHRQGPPTPEREAAR